jgi:hypothetical protein
MDQGCIQIGARFSHPFRLALGCNVTTHPQIVQKLTPLLSILAFMVGYTVHFTFSETYKVGKKNWGSVHGRCSDLLATGSKQCYIQTHSYILQALNNKRDVLGILSDLAKVFELS